VEAYAATRTSLAADVADSSVVLKSLVVRAEDARLLGAMGPMKRAYRQLVDINR
jgi:Bardet-Biedl syndrome 2 protein